MILYVQILWWSVGGYPGHVREVVAWAWALANDVIPPPYLFSRLQHAKATRARSTPTPTKFAGGEAASTDVSAAGAPAAGE